jgi:hypothetical protein
MSLDRQAGSEYNAWVNMISRCRRAKKPGAPPEVACYKDVRVCEEWQGRGGFEGFFQHVGLRPPGMSLDRKDPFGHYEPGNVRWATATEQRVNQRHLTGNREVC